MTTEQASTKRTGGCSFTSPYGEESVSYAGFLRSLEHAKWAVEHGGWTIAQVSKVQLKKRKERGAFKKRIILDES